MWDILKCLLSRSSDAVKKREKNSRSYLKINFNMTETHIETFYIEKFSNLMHFPMISDFNTLILQLFGDYVLTWDQYLAFHPVGSFSLASPPGNWQRALIFLECWTNSIRLSLRVKLTALSPLLMSGSARQTEISCSVPPPLTIAAHIWEH